MRNGIALSVIRTEVLIEAGFGTSTGSAAFSQERITQMINRTERLMYEMDDWGSLNFEETITAAANTQFHTLPTNIRFGDIQSAHVEYGKEWLPISHGISPEDRSIYDTVQRSSPAMKWEVVAAVPIVQFELWPIASAAQDVLFSGQKTLGTMNDENDICTLDADIIVLRAAAEILGRDKKDDASLKLSMAQGLTNSLTKKLGSTKAVTVNTGARRKPNLRPGIDYIAPGSP